MDASVVQLALPIPNLLAKTTMVFVSDGDSEGVIRQCLSDLSVPNPEFATGGVDGAIAALTKRASPRLLIVDIQGTDDPVPHIRELANVCDPQTGVIVIGDVNDIRVYRGLKEVGVVEYYYKPLVRSLVLQTCQDILTGATTKVQSRDGKLILVVSIRGGSGGTMIATSTARYLAEAHNRRVGLVDLDMQFGDSALQLDATPTHALKEALDHPERVDELFLDRAIIQVGARLGLLAGLEPLAGFSPPNEAAVMSLLSHLLRRNRYVFVDIPSSVAPGLLHLLHLPGTVVLVSSASLACARDVARWRNEIGRNSAELTMVHVLNKSGANDGLSDEEFVRAVGVKPDIKIPFSREIGAAALLGVRGLEKCAPFQKGLAPLYRQLSGEEEVVIASKAWHWFRQ
jgi:pilus assembly protein CpaE